MVRFFGGSHATWLGAGLLSVVASIGPAMAQMSSNPAEINACLCQEQGIATLSANMATKTGALAAARQRVADLDARLAQSRQHIDENNTAEVEQYKALLADRDRAYQESIGPVVGEADQATARYNAYVNQYNAQCANRQFNSEMMAEIRTHLSCPPLQ